MLTSSHSWPQPTISWTWKMHRNLSVCIFSFPCVVIRSFLISRQPMRARTHTHTYSKVCVTLETHQRLSLWVRYELMEKKRRKKDPQCAGKEEPFVPETLFILHLCGNITDFAWLHCVFFFFQFSFDLGNDFHKTNWAPIVLCKVWDRKNLSNVTR